MNAVSLLCEIIAQRGKVASGFYDGEAFDALVRHRFLREAGVVSTVVCGDCDVPHSAPVVYEGGSYGHYCDQAGFVALDPATITAYVPDLPELVRRLAEAFECRQRKASSLHGQTWRVGRVETGHVSIMLYFHQTLQSEDDARDLQSALGREARSDWRLVVTAQGRLPLADLTLVRLDDLVEICAETGSLRCISNPGELAGVPQKNPGGRPVEHGPLIVAIIEERIVNGQALKGRNKEADVVLDLFVQRHPDKKIPSQSSVRDYVTKLRTGH